MWRGRSRCHPFASSLALPQTQLAFFAFLQDAQLFYLRLALKLQQRLGDGGLPHGAPLTFFIFFD